MQALLPVIRKMVAVWLPVDMSLPNTGFAIGMVNITAPLETLIMEGRHDSETIISALLTTQGMRAHCVFNADRLLHAQRQFARASTGFLGTNLETLLQSLKGSQWLPFYAYCAVANSLLVSLNYHNETDYSPLWQESYNDGLSPLQAIKAIIHI
jgi:hypothetical protein